MTRKDSEKDAERPHYYSQFWLDIAAGRRVIGGPKPEDAETSEPETQEHAPLRKAGRSAPTVSDSYRSPVASPAIEPATDDVDDALDETELPNIVVEDEIDNLDDVDAEDDFMEEENEDDFFPDEEEEEEEEDEEWSRRGRKKAKPVRPPKPAIKPKRNPRRGF